MTVPAHATRGQIRGRIGFTDVIVATILIVTLSTIVSCNMAGLQAHADRVPFRYAAYARSMQRSCPAIAARLDEYLDDGKVTPEEDAVIQTIFDQQRALPGGMATCRMPDPVPYAQ